MTTRPEPLVPVWTITVHWGDFTPTYRTVARTTPLGASVTSSEAEARIRRDVPPDYTVYATHAARPLPYSCVDVLDVFHD